MHAFQLGNSLALAGVAQECTFARSELIKYPKTDERSAENPLESSVHSARVWRHCHVAILEDSPQGSFRAGVETLATDSNELLRCKFIPRGCGDTGGQFRRSHSQQVHSARVWRHCGNLNVLKS